MSTDSFHTYLTIFGILLMATIVRSQDLGLEENVKDILARRKNLDYVRQLVEDMDNQLNRLQKRTCYVNAGMSDSCDYKTLVKDLNNELTWSAGETPGKRKRNGGEAMKETHSEIGRFLRSMRKSNLLSCSLSKRSCILRLPGMDCDYGGVTGNAKDHSFWVGDDSPGKKRSYQYSCDFKVGNPEGCLGKLVDGDKKDNSHWGDPDGPGRK
ncbi:hypothetical protein HNY73_018003 [Argiope bruennichi]|uniref:Uncharacterized protein n=1 Tax=Argiope bruennichi TaxID=94029 RepID=A0A8T0ECL0_ARGBR|nr:hypothetical protein HNY73_018003 [Argiope bruennichi]